MDIRFIKKTSVGCLLVASLMILLFACKKDEIDDEKPEINIDFDAAFPGNCDTLYFGETFALNLLFTDNKELGSTRAFSLDIHNNFDHHSHSTEVTECDLGAIKDAVNAYAFIQTYDIPKGVKEYQAEFEITLPHGNNEGVYDEGDYHFFISVTDKEGWSAQKGLSIKILKR